MKPTLHRPLVPLTMALVLGLTVSACSQDEPAVFETATTQDSVADEAAEPAGEESADDGPTTAGTGSADGSGAADSTADDASYDVTARSAAAAGVDLAAVGDPIGTTTVPAVVEGDNAATMDVSLYSLTRDGETVVAVYSFHVNSETGADTAKALYHYLGNRRWTPHLIDTTNLTRHDVLAGGTTQAMTDSQRAHFRPGQTLFAYAAFAAPPEDVDTMTASVVDGGAVVQEVPVQ